METVTVERAGEILARMTVEEKVAQLGSVWVYELLTDGRFCPRKAEQKIGRGIGQITRVGGASNLTPQESARLGVQTP